MKSAFGIAVLVLVLFNSNVFAFGAKGSSRKSGETIWVVRSDGAKSCSPEVTESIDQGAALLRGAQIQVLESRKGSDGMMHAQVCGADTGSLNGYLIQKSDLKRALDLGFKEAPVTFSGQSK